ncbi:hypothetical protein HK097_009826 [Rhizophlyctis rosea]|uniref:Uncharacterized protein n=1 Tax=Rhizophlyctis rosea TaxID=64517 RepID=A0AAD5X061_9FUNG|nr:hypothetical protein HK097_009826 [Rhizophlyctis rosea]
MSAPKRRKIAISDDQRAAILRDANLRLTFSAVIATAAERSITTVHGELQGVTAYQEHAAAAYNLHIIEHSPETSQPRVYGSEGAQLVKLDIIEGEYQLVEDGDVVGASSWMYFASSTSDLVLQNMSPADDNEETEVNDAACSARNDMDEDMANLEDLRYPARGLDYEGGDKKVLGWDIGETNDNSAGDTLLEWTADGVSEDSSRTQVADSIAAYYMASGAAGKGIVTVDDVEAEMVVALSRAGFPNDGKLYSISCSEKSREDVTIGRRHRALMTSGFRSALLTDFSGENWGTGLTQLPADAAVVDLHTTAYPLSAIDILRALLLARQAHGAQLQLAIFLTFATCTGTTQTEIMQRDVEEHNKAGGQSNFDRHLDLFRRWSNHDNSIDMIVSDMKQLISEMLNDFGLVFAGLPPIGGPMNTAGPLRVFAYEQEDIRLCCLGFRLVKLPRQTARFTVKDALRVQHDFMFHDEIRWEKYPDLLYCPLTLTKEVLKELQERVIPFIRGRLRRFLDDYVDPPLAVVAKIISILVPRDEPGYDEVYDDLFIYGKEREGKSGGLMLPTLIANTMSIKRILTRANRTIRTILAVGPNTRGPDEDAVQKFASVREFFRVSRLMRKNLKGLRDDFPIDVYVFGDSVSRSEVVKDLIEKRKVDSEGREIDYVLVIDEASHIFGRGTKDGAYCKAEAAWRRIIDFPNVRSRVWVDATPGPLFERNRGRVLREKGVHVIRIRTDSNYYGADRIEVRFPLDNAVSLDYAKNERGRWDPISDGQTTRYNGTHECLSAYLDEPSCSCLQTGFDVHGNELDESQKHVVHPMFLIGMTEKVKPAMGMRELAGKLAEGKYQDHRWDENEQQWVRRTDEKEWPVCALKVGRGIEIFVFHQGEVVEQTAKEFLLRNYADDTELWPPTMEEKQKANRANSYGDDIGTCMPRIMKYYGLNRPVCMLGYGRFARLVTTAFSAIFDKEMHVWIVTHAAMRVLKLQRNNEYTKCMEDIRQFLFRVLTRTYGLNLDPMFGEHFRIVMATQASVKADVLDHIRTTDAFMHQLGIHRDLELAHNAIGRAAWPTGLYGRQHKSTKRKQLNPITVQAKPYDFLEVARSHRPALAAYHERKWDKLPLDMVYQYVTGKRHIEEHFREAEEDLNAVKVKVEVIPSDDSVFDTNDDCTDVVEFSDQERTLIWELFDLTARTELTALRERVGRSPNAPTNIQETAIELFSAFWAFNYTWQKVNMGGIVTGIPVGLRRKGFIIAFLWFGLNERQQAVGLTAEEVNQLQTLVGCTDPDVHSLMVANPGFLHTIPMLHAVDNFYLAHEDFVVRRDAMVKTLSCYVGHDEHVLGRFVKSCNHHTSVVIRRNRTAWDEISTLATEVTHTCVQELITTCVQAHSPQRRFSDKEGYSWFLKAVLSEYDKRVIRPDRNAAVGSSKQHEKRPVAESWWLLLSPWWEYFSGAILALHFEEGISPREFARLYKRLYGSLHGIENVFSCWDSLTSGSLSNDRPQTYAEPVVTLGEDGRYYLVKAWAKFFTAHDYTISIKGLDPDFSNYLRKEEIPALTYSILEALRKDGFRSSLDGKAARDERAGAYERFAQKMRLFPAQPIRAGEAAYATAICLAFLDPATKRYHRIVSFHTAKERIGNLRTTKRKGLEIATEGWGDFVKHTTNLSKTTAGIGGNPFFGVPLLVREGETLRLHDKLTSLLVDEGWLTQT